MKQTLLRGTPGNQPRGHRRRERSVIRHHQENKERQQKNKERQQSRTPREAASCHVRQHVLRAAGPRPARQPHAPPHFPRRSHPPAPAPQPPGRSTDVGGPSTERPAARGGSPTQGTAPAAHPGRTSSASPLERLGRQLGGRDLVLRVLRLAVLPRLVEHDLRAREGLLRGGDLLRQSGSRELMTPPTSLSAVKVRH